MFVCENNENEQGCITCGHVSSLLLQLLILSLWASLHIVGSCLASIVLILSFLIHNNYFLTFSEEGVDTEIEK